MSFVNHLNQEINPGDKVVVVTTGYSHRVNVREGIFIGVHKNGGVQCEVDSEKYDWYDKRTDVSRSYSSFNADEIEHRGIRKVLFKRRTTLQLNRVYKLA